MTIRTWFSLGAVAVLLATAGCSGSSSTPPLSKPTPPPSPTSDEAAEIATALAKLSPEDKKLAEAQKLCPVSGHALGSMDVPIKLTLKGEAVFICCASCKKGAEKDPDATLKKAADSKAKVGEK